MLSAFGYGYVTTQLLGGRAAERFGVRAVYGRCLAACGALTLLSPVAARCVSANGAGLSDFFCTKAFFFEITLKVCAWILKHFKNIILHFRS